MMMLRHRTRNEAFCLLLRLYPALDENGRFREDRSTDLNNIGETGTLIRIE